MKFSTRTIYGLKAVLVLAGRFGEGSVSVSTIAKKYAISTPYLEQILNTLKKKGFVKSVRGPQGGYVLSKKPSEISLEELFFTLEDRLSVENTKLGPEADEAVLASAFFWKKFNRTLEEGLSEMTLKDLIDEARLFRKEKRKNSHVFHI